MPYKDVEAAKEASRERMRRMRGRNKEGVTPSQNVTPDVRPNVTPSVAEKYPHIIHVLADPDKRVMLRKVCESLARRNLLGEVRYGGYGPTMDVVANLLTAFDT